MCKFITSRVWRLSIVLIIVLALFPLAVSAQDDGPQTVEASTAEMPAPIMTQAVLLEEPPTLTEEQKAQMEWGLANTHLPGPALAAGTAESAGPVPGTESVSEDTRVRSGQPLVPGTLTTFRWKQFGASIPAGFKSNIMESSLDGKAARLFFTGNWFAAASTNKGINWTFRNPFADFPAFCCDQVVLHETSRDLFLWLRMGVPSWVGGNYENVFKLSVSFREPFNAGYWTYTIRPMDTNPAWTNQFWDYPHMQMGADYLYIAWNLFDQNGNWTRTVMLRWSLDALAAGAAASYNYYDQSQWFTFVPVSGADHTMYWASNWELPPYDRLAIWRWDEDSNIINWWVNVIAPWTPTSAGMAHCGTPNWLARTDMRVLTGARYSIYSDGIAEPRQRGRKVLGWWWNVAEGGGFSYPYIEGAAFYEDTLVQLPGFIGRPYMWGYDYCFAYPSTEPNARQDLGMVFNFAVVPNLHRPNAGYAVADDYVWAPPGWNFKGATASNAGPSDQVWGDYNTARAFMGLQTWLAGVHYIPGAVNCANCSEPLFFSFGRERDQNAFWYW